MRLRSWAVVLIFVGLFCAPGEARVFVLSGDSTPAFSLTNTEPDVALPGNGVFFSNVLGSGNDVAVLSTAFNVNRAPTEINEYYSSLPGKTSVLINGPVTATQLAGKELLVIAVPSTNFTPAEIDAMSSFYLAGGSIFALGEAETIDFGEETNTILNGLMSGLAVPMSLQQHTFDVGLTLAVVGQIASHPLTAGVGSFRYGATTDIIGGTPLFFTSTHLPFVAVVPEPMMLSSVVVGAVLMRPRRRD